VITEVKPAIGLAEAAVQAASAAMPAGELLTATAASAEVRELDLASAVLVSFSGPASGELALLVDSGLSTALQGATIGQLDLALALAPTLDAIARAMGPVVLGPAQALDARLAIARIAAHADVATAALTGSASIRAAVIVGLDGALDAGAAGAPGTPGAPAVARVEPAFDRLDLLRGVEMAASAELGRARMTVNDLLSLRNGSVIELDRAAGEAADLFVNGRLIAKGEVVVVDENYALRITSIVTEDGH
jgi:flagellar motor switch protein FliN